MAGLPTGTVTFLFADLAGGAELWSRHEAAMHACWPRYTRLVSDTVTRHSGHLVSGGGRGRPAAAFARATDALAAACALQQAVFDTSWPVPEPFRICIALLTGEAVRPGRTTAPGEPGPGPGLLEPA